MAPVFIYFAIIYNENCGDIRNRQRPCHDTSAVKRFQKHDGITDPESQDLKALFFAYIPRERNGYIMKKHRLLAGFFAAALSLSLAAVTPALADTFSSTGNGAVVRMDDGSRIEYNARGGSITIYDTRGNVVDTEYDVQLTESEFKELFYTPSSSSRSSSSSSKYWGSEINDCYWGASNSRFIAHWDADYQSSGKYTVTLYRDGRKVTSKSSKGGKSVDFTEAIANANKTGDYYFHVKASWGSGITDEDDSDSVYVDSSALSRIRSNSSSSSSGSSTGAAGPGGTPGTVLGPAGNNGWQQFGNTWKYQKSPGVYAANAWELINGKWYYFDGAGYMAANQWVQTDAWYYVGNDGDMLVNQWIQSKTDTHIWYYVGGDGRMVTNTVVNGWPINAAGECYF